MSIGLHTWETVNVVHKGANYGYSAREGNEQLLPDERRAAADAGPDSRPGGPDRRLARSLPPIRCSINHTQGFAITGGFVYHGTKAAGAAGQVPARRHPHRPAVVGGLRRDARDDDGKPGTVAALHDVNIRWDDPNDSPDAGATWSIRR